ncbi:GNAT family N-acetyltransferase [Terasakiella sp. A23]|uniref:GNAT family N-acetyltransferase n=1 Tax=Terasakiella sp. FCG-A23 TaxID=3080561 RepID=UPI0029548FBC|nr:GNAT family N-acetyltransferase [Terasakiella sp. A23]MDV7339869.1 GNAT family N-acetyltransferase [Terasakiella sp. A23]
MKTIKNGFTLKTGYQNGLVGWVSSLHGQTYQDGWNLGESFEILVARELCDFMDSHQPLNSQIWSLQKDGKFYGSITLDGSHANQDGAHLRWFILDPKARGQGFGRLLLETAIAFARDRSFKSIYLHTLEGLEPAATLYESCGFKIEAKEVTRRWGQDLGEVKYRLKL